jgi:hypothetical protein
MAIWFVAAASCLTANDVTLEQAKAYLDGLGKLDRDISFHVREVDRIAQRFAFLSENDKKIRARIKYLENVGKVRRAPSKHRTPDIVIRPISRSVFSRAPPRQFSFINRNKAPVRVFEFRSTSERECNFNDFIARFRLAEEGQIEVRWLRLNGSNSAYLKIPLPTAIAFSEMILIASTNYGDGQKFCPPEVIGDGALFPSFD